MDSVLAMDIENIIIEKVASLGRADLFRKPLVGFSAARDTKYEDLKKLIGEWHLKPTEILENAETVISYFIPFTKEVVIDPKKVVEGSALC